MLNMKHLPPASRSRAKTGLLPHNPIVREEGRKETARPGRSCVIENETQMDDLEQTWADRIIIIIFIILVEIYASDLP